MFIESMNARGGGRFLMLFVAATTTFLAGGGARAAPTAAPLLGEVLELTVDNPADHWSGGTMVVGDERIILPRNLLIDFPANRMTLAEVFAQAPAGCAPQSGLARNDGCRCGLGGAIATVNANRTNGGNLIAGEVHFAKGNELLSGDVTFIDFDNGFFRINGTPGSATAGIMVRINDPVGRHTVQRGPGCTAGAPNCSPDVRFNVDPDNYTAAFSTGYPICVPSTFATALRIKPSSATGIGDAFCPDTNRSGNTTTGKSFTAPDSTRFAPILLGDNLTVTGNREVIGGTEFISTWSVVINGQLLTRDDPTQPDYPHIIGVIWDVPGYGVLRDRLTLKAATTLPPAQVDMFSIHRDPGTNGMHEVPLGTTHNNLLTFFGFPNPPGIFFRLQYVNEFINLPDAKTDPCTNLVNGGFPCPGPRGAVGSFMVLSPPAREIIARSRHAVNPNVVAKDISGNPTTSGLYLTPVTFNYPTPVEFNPLIASQPLIFEGIPWLADRRLSADGCTAAGCETTPQPLSPFPFSGLDPRTQDLLPTTETVLSFFPFGPANKFAFPQVDPAAVPLAPFVPQPLACLAAPLAPTLATIVPSRGPQGTFQNLALTGTNFVPGMTCTFGAGINSACLTLSPTSAQALLQIDAAATVGPRDVVLTNPGGGTVTKAAGFTVDLARLPAPAITLIAPTTGLQGTSTVVAIAGTGFVTGTTCSFGAGIAATCAVTSPTALAAGLTISATAALGTRDLVVTNPDGQIVTSLAAFTVVAAKQPAPVVASAAPATAAQGGTAIATITGTGFAPGANCTFGAGVTSACTVASATSMTAVISVAAAALPGPRDVVVTNPDGQASTLVGGFTLTQALPAPGVSLLASVNPVAPGGSTTLTFASSGATSLTLSPGGALTGTGGTLVVSPATTTTYLLTGTGPGGTATAALTVTVLAAGNLPPTAALTATPSTIVAGTSTTLTFSSANATTAALGPGAASVPTNGSLVVSPGATTTFTFLVTGPGGSASAQATVTVAPAAPPPPIFSDTFKRVGALGANWAAPAFGDFRLDGLAASGLQSWNEAAAIMPATANFRADATVVEPPGGGGAVGMRLRADPIDPFSANYGVFLEADFVRLLRVEPINGETVLVEQAIPVNQAAAHKLSATVTGTSPVTIAVSLDGVVVFTFNDASPQRIVKPGVVTISGGKASWQTLGVFVP